MALHDNRGRAYAQHRAGGVAQKHLLALAQLAGKDDAMITVPTDARLTLDRATSERDFQATVLQAACYFGWFCYHTHDSRRSQAGFPDLVCVKPPRCLFIELKSCKGRVKPAQQQWLSKLALCPGVEVYVYRPDMWGEIMATLSA